jgi:DNA-binding NarL/FixJ family response regulator
MYSILTIEDDPAICSNIELILKMEGFAVTAADSATKAFEMIRAARPDLILCDILMPGMDGRAFLELLKKEPEYADIPFIFVTALGERSDMRQGMAAGADDYLSKPFSAEELVTAVKGRLERHQAIRLQGPKMAFKEEYEFLQENISPREREVLLLVGKGATSKEIAKNLGISQRTAEVHRANLMNKLRASNAAVLSRWAMIAEMM